MQSDSTDDLNVVMALSQCSPRCFAHCGEGFGEQVIEGFPAVQPLAELGGLGLQLLVVELLKVRLKAVDRVLDGGQLLQGLVVGVAYYLLKN